MEGGGREREKVGGCTTRVSIDYYSRVVATSPIYSPKCVYVYMYGDASSLTQVYIYTNTYIACVHEIERERASPSHLERALTLFLSVK